MSPHNQIPSLIHPVARGLATLFVIVGTILADDIAPLLIMWLVILVPSITATRILKRHGRMLLSTVLPLGLLFVLLRGWIVSAPPDMPAGSDSGVNIRYAMMIVLQLTVFAGMLQLCFYSIPPSQLLSTFRHWGIRGHLLTVAIVAFTIRQELKMQTEQILTARYARGLMPDRRFIMRIRQVPYIFRPLLAWSLRDAIRRSEFWVQRQWPERAGRRETVEKNAMMANAAAVGVGLAWLGYQLLS